MRVLICVLIVLFCCCEAQDDVDICGQNLKTDKDFGLSTRITDIDPESDPLGTYPWMVSLGLAQGQAWSHQCGGVIISREFVLTAAHCINSDSLKLRIGDRDLNSPEDDSEAAIIDISEIILHPEYDRVKPNAYYDIAVIRAKSRIAYTKFTRPVCLPPRAVKLDQYSGFQVTVSGWGFSTRNSYDAGDVLRAVPIKIYPQMFCNQRHSQGISRADEFQINKHLPKLFTKNIMCAGYESDSYGPCKGDSGSPLVRYQFNPPAYVLQGLVQGGIGACGDKDFPAIFTRIDADEILGFISKETGIPIQEPVVVEESVLEPSLELDSQGANLEEKTLLLIDNVLQLVLLQPNFTQFNLEHTDNWGNSLTMHLAKLNRYSGVEAMLNAGANIHHVNNFGSNALTFASSANGTLRIVDLLISHGINIFKPDLLGRNALHYAAHSGNLPVIQRLLAKGLLLDRQDRLGQTALFHAVQAGHYGTAEYLLEQGADINARTQTDKHLPIHFTVGGPNGSLVIELLLDHGADLESKDVSEGTPLFYSFYYEHLNTTEELYRLGANLEVLNYVDISVLDKAAETGQIEHIKWLRQLEGGAVFRRLLNHQRSTGATALITAVQNRQGDVVQELLDAGADQSITDEAGRTAKDWALFKGYHAIAALLD